jgi:hypothetical protein
MADALEMKMELMNREVVKKLLTSIGRDTRDLRGAMDAVGRATIRYFGGQVFASRGATSNGGRRWRRLSDSYAAQKAKDYRGRPMLVRAGHLQTSFKHTADDSSVVVRTLRSTSLTTSHRRRESSCRVAQ